MLSNTHIPTAWVSFNLRQVALPDLTIVGLIPGRREPTIATPYLTTTLWTSIIRF